VRRSPSSSLCCDRNPPDAVRKRWLAKINIVFTNRITSLFAGWFPGSAFSRTRVCETLGGMSRYFGFKPRKPVCFHR
jgi:hypothetical protein